MKFSENFDVIVIGGGHAGTEAALASSRMGANTLLITHNIDTLGQMSCNPAIGGIGKSHLVKEIDALGGVMARAADFSGIQFRVLNSKKGPAVRATRAQVDRFLYKQYIQKTVQNQENLCLFQQSVDDLIIKEDCVCGIMTQSGVRFFAKTVILATGTFLGGKIHIGMNSYSGGRSGEKSSTTLSSKLRGLPFKVKRLKTGTPPRIDARSVDFTKMEEQKGDTPIPVMSYVGCVEQHPEQRSCYITHTNNATHDIISKNLDRSPLYTGVIGGVGPRYCPSIEDKVQRFSSKSSHQVFIEPEGLWTQELYPNGISTSLPFETQVKLVQSISGLENALITRPGYAIEYDYFDPRDLLHTLETRYIKNLYFAGQINGTTGYEEAASQGLIAGINAALKTKERSGWYPGRDQAYIGVMIDDLIMYGTSEPYRMFTSRAEYRLLLREDNADQRLTPTGRKLGLVDDERWRFFCEKQKKIEQISRQLEKTIVHPKTKESEVLQEKTGLKLSKEHSLLNLLKRPEVSIQDVDGVQTNTTLDYQAAEQVEINCKYKGYIDRQEKEIVKLKTSEEKTIPEDFDYQSVPGLSTEVKQKLKKKRPKNIGQASRISGVTPAAISLLLVYLKKRSATKKKTLSL